jgi:hypothetical protein
MTIPQFAKTKALLSSGFGLLFIISPSWTMSWFGVSLDAGGDLVGRFFGVLVIGICVELWFVTKAEDFKPQSTLAYALTDALAVIFCVIAVMNGTVNALGWVLVASYALSTLGFAHSYRKLKEV